VKDTNSTILIQPEFPPKRIIRLTEPKGRFSVTYAGANRPGEIVRPREIVQPAKDADYWRRCAKEARSTAEAMNVPAAKREMLMIAAAYERLADHSESTARRRPAGQKP
jgi:hypothetical protein